MASRMFDQFDKGKNNRIDANEFITAMYVMMWGDIDEKVPLAIHPLVPLHGSPRRFLDRVAWQIETGPSAAASPCRTSWLSPDSGRRYSLPLEFFRAQAGFQRARCRLRRYALRGDHRHLRFSTVSPSVWTWALAQPEQAS